MAARARSAVKPRPPVVMVTVIPAAVAARMIVGEVVAEVGLAADQGELHDAELGHLADEIEGLAGSSSSGRRAAGARAAVAAGEVAARG